MEMMLEGGIASPTDNARTLPLTSIPPLSSKVWRGISRVRVVSLTWMQPEWRGVWSVNMCENVCDDDEASTGCALSR